MNGEGASEGVEKEKEEGELTTDEDDEGENEGDDARQEDLPPPTKRLCRRNGNELFFWLSTVTLSLKADNQCMYY